MLIGTVVQLLLPLPWLRRPASGIVRYFNWRDERVMRVLKLMFPVTLGLGLINFNLSVDSIFATLISEEAPAAIDKAFRIYMLPQGVFAVALATVLFPTLSRLAARGDTRRPARRRSAQRHAPDAAAARARGRADAGAERADHAGRSTSAASSTPRRPTSSSEALFFFALLAAVRRREPDPDPDLLQPPAALDADA